MTMSYRLPFNPVELNRPWNWERHIPSIRLPILVTGVAGVVGFNAFHFLRQKYPGQVLGIRPVSNTRLEGEGILGLDPENRDAMKALFQQYRFGSVLSCGGSCALKSCELDPAMARRVNVDSVRSLRDVIIEHETRLVHTSIDLVFSGIAGGGYDEDSPTDPVTRYGRTMVQAEEMLRPLPGAAILRISLPMGLSFNGHAGAVDWIQNRFAKQRPATLYYDEIRTPTYTHCMNHLLERMLANDLAGLFHAGGPTRISLYQIAQIVNLVGGYDPHLLHGCHRLEAGPIPPRAGNVTMCSQRLRDAMGDDLFQPWPWDSKWIPTGRDWHYRRDRLWSGAPHKIAELLYSLPGHFDGRRNRALRSLPATVTRS